jgi:hypothetical protein
VPVLFEATICSSCIEVIYADMVCFIYIHSIANILLVYRCVLGEAMSSMIKTAFVIPIHPC